MLREGGITIKGLMEFDEQLRTLPAKVRDKVIVQALKRAGQTMADEAKLRVPVAQHGKNYVYMGRTTRHNPGTLKAAITTRRDKRAEDLYTINQAVFVKKGRRRGEGAFYAHMVEFGHKIVIIVGRRRKRLEKGHYPAQAYMRGAFDAKKEEMSKNFRDHLARRVPRLIKKWTV